jgi:hypothetical protein
MKNALFIILAGVIVIGISQLVGALAGDTVGNIVFVALCVVAFFVVRQRSRRQRVD